MSEYHENTIMNLELEIDGLSEDLQNIKAERDDFRLVLEEIAKGGSEIKGVWWTHSIGELKHIASKALKETQ